MASLSNPAHVGDYSVALGTAVATACASNLSRSFLMLQNTGVVTTTATGSGTSTGTVTTTPTSAVFSFTNPNPVAGSSGCFVLGTGGAPLVFSPVVPDGPIYVGTGAGALTILQG